VLCAVNVNKVHHSFADTKKAERMMEGKAFHTAKMLEVTEGTDDKMAAAPVNGVRVGIDLLTFVVDFVLCVLCEFSCAMCVEDVLAIVSMYSLKKVVISVYVYGTLCVVYSGGRLSQSTCRLRPHLYTAVTATRETYRSNANSVSYRLSSSARTCTLSVRGGGLMNVHVNALIYVAVTR
jgi:hypothetical protein